MTRCVSSSGCKSRPTMVVTADGSRTPWGLSLIIRDRDNPPVILPRRDTIGLYPHMHNAVKKEKGDDSEDGQIPPH
jgi:hypothetical protein